MSCSWTANNNARLQQLDASLERCCLALEGLALPRATAVLLPPASLRLQMTWNEAAHTTAAQIIADELAPRLSRQAIDSGLLTKLIRRRFRMN